MVVVLGPHGGDCSLPLVLRVSAQLAVVRRDPPRHHLQTSLGCVDLLVSLPFCSPACRIELIVHDSCGYESLWVVDVGGAIVFSGPFGGCGGAMGGFDVWFGGDGVGGFLAWLFVYTGNGRLLLVIGGRLYTIWGLCFLL
ncbi:hypothetical protein MtrunA17_Chr3g0116851 [Medicago truncatula]|uniref:Uncharacterized protein n=1 Tax=Medicago truncatula TaxID=3880 RepID=A0A396IT23_MEDTR|nr:hypothetical protein MtrunA17_Chr3g0116851 [Medicago truncatula]